MRRSAVVAGLLLLAGSLACGGGEGNESGISRTAPSEEQDSTSSSEEQDPTSSSTTDQKEPGWFGDYLTEGECWNLTPDGEGGYVYTGVPQEVDCSEEHAVETVLVFPIESEDGTFPGDDAIDPDGKRCIAAFVDYVGAEDEDTALTWFERWPSEEEWADGGRNVICSTYLEVSIPGGYAPIVGSVRGEGRDVLPATLPEGIPIPDDAVLSDLDTAEGGDYVATFSFPGSRQEANLATLEAFERQSDWQISSSAEGSSLTTFQAESGGQEATIVTNEFSWGVEWWLYFPNPGED